MIRMSVKDYSDHVGKTPQGVRHQIEHGLLPQGVTVNRYGKAFIISVESKRVLNKIKKVVN